MTTGSIYSVLHGIHYGLFLTEAKRGEDAARAGAYNFNTAFLQFIQGCQTVSLVGQVIQMAGRSPLPWVGRMVIQLTPFALLGLHNTSTLPQSVQPVSQFLENRYGTLCQVAGVVSSIALFFFFNQPVFATSSLLILAIGALERQGLIPLAGRKSFHRVSPLFMTITGLIFGGTLTKIMIGSNLLVRGINLYLSHKKFIPKDLKTEGNLTLEQARSFFERKHRITVNKQFIYYRLAPKIPEVEISSLKTLFSQIDRSQHTAVLRKKLEKDDRFKRQYPNQVVYRADSSCVNLCNPHKGPSLDDRSSPILMQCDPPRDPQNLSHSEAPQNSHNLSGRSISDEEVWEFALHSFNTLLDEVENKKILNGEPESYDQLIDYLKMIAYCLPKTDEVTKVDILFRLAVEGGEYCGTGKFEAIEESYNTLIESEISLTNQVFHFLQNERKKWIEKYFSWLITYLARWQTSNVTANQVIGITNNDLFDIHAFNTFISPVNESLGLHKGSAENDGLAQPNPLLKLIAATAVLKLFWMDHDPDTMIRYLQQLKGPSSIKLVAFYEFLQNWIENLPISAEEKTDLIEELSTGTLFGRTIDEGKQVRSDWIILMLVEMGILQITPISRSM